MEDAWKSNETNHWKECSECAEKMDSETHIYQWVVDKTATEDEVGFKHEECACGSKRSEVTEESNTDVNEPTKKEEVSLVSPQTGDTGNNFNAWIFIFLGALAGFVGVNVVGYRKEHNK